jgi:hypothetical protein
MRLHDDFHASPRCGRTPNRWCRFNNPTILMRQGGGARCIPELSGAAVEREAVWLNR